MYMLDHRKAAAAIAPASAKAPLTPTRVASEVEPDEAEPDEAAPDAVAAGVAVAIALTPPVTGPLSVS